MNPPREALFIGHPIIALPVCLATAAAFFGGFDDHSWWIAAFLLIWPCLAVGRANAKRTEYFQWKQAWDGMSEPTRQKPPRPATPARWRRPWLGGLMLAAIWLFCLANADDPLDRLALVWLTVAGIIIGIALLSRRMKTTLRGNVKGQSVAVCLSGPLLPVPSLKNAYRALPDHCRTVLGIGPR